jgi:hypothetical protein
LHTQTFQDTSRIVLKKQAASFQPSLLDSFEIPNPPIASTLSIAPFDPLMSLPQLDDSNLFHPPLVEYPFGLTSPFELVS